MICFVDTSALAKAYHQESGTDFMLALYLGNGTIRISELTRVEFVSTTRRKVQSGQITEDMQEACLERFAVGLKSRYEVLRLGTRVLEEAAQLLGPKCVSIPLRSLDAIQFATFKLLCSCDTTFVCSDKRLASIAISQGQKVVDPSLP